MTEPWTASMGGAPWTTDKMLTAVTQLRRRATIDFVVGVDALSDLVQLDEQVFSKRPDLILNIYNPLDKGADSELFIQSLAQLKHLTSLKLSIKHQQNLDMLGALSRMDFLYIRSPKKQNLNFIRTYKQLTYLYLSGSFDNLSPIADCISLQTLVLNCSINSLDFIANLPSLAYFAMDNCNLACTLNAITNSNITMLRLASVRGITSINELENMNSLTFLHLSLLKIEKLGDLTNMNNLKQLELYSLSSLKEIHQLWSGKQIEVLELRELSKGISAEALYGITTMENLRQVDFRYIDNNKNRITALRKHIFEAGKEYLLVEKIDTEKQIPSIALTHLSRILM